MFKKNRKHANNDFFIVYYCVVQVCQTEVRRRSFGMLITKECKLAHACDYNFAQVIKILIKKIWNEFSYQ